MTSIRTGQFRAAIPRTLSFVLALVLTVLVALPGIGSARSAGRHEYSPYGTPAIHAPATDGNPQSEGRLVTKSYNGQFAPDGVKFSNNILDPADIGRPTSSFNNYGATWVRNGAIPAAQSALGWAHMFTARPWDSNIRQYYFRHRWYDPHQCRWVSLDPLGYSGGIEQYAYCGWNPICFVDPLGLEGYSEALRGMNEALTDMGESLGAWWENSKDNAIDNLERGRDIGRTIVREARNGIGALRRDLTASAGEFLDHQIWLMNNIALDASLAVLGGPEVRAIDAAAGRAAVRPAVTGSAVKCGALAAEEGSVRGTFSIADWTRYPKGYPRPAGPFKLLEGSEYETARRQADMANRALHKANPQLKGMEIHEIHPVKFGGSPTDPANKLPLLPEDHRPFTTWWRQVQRKVESQLLAVSGGSSP
jgi:RHS repeat-associated protein